MSTENYLLFAVGSKLAGQLVGSEKCDPLHTYFTYTLVRFTAVSPSEIPPPQLQSTLVGFQSLEL